MTNCPACGNAATFPLLASRGHEVRRCRDCGHVFTPELAGVEALYGNEYFRDHYAPRARALRHWFAAALARMPPSGPGKRLLDVGSGMGLFLLEAKASGWQVTGVEPSQAGIDASLRAGLSNGELHHGAFADFDTLDGSFDVITFWDSLAHIHDLRGTLLKARRLLRPGGLLIVKTPHRPHRVLAGGRIVERLRPGAALHLLPLRTQTHHFTPRRLDRLLTDLAFVRIAWRWTNEVPTPRPAATNSLRRLVRKTAQAAMAVLTLHPSFIMEATVPHSGLAQSIRDRTPRNAHRPS